MFASVCYFCAQTTVDGTKIATLCSNSTRKNVTQAARKIGRGASRRGQFCATRVSRFCAWICEIAREVSTECCNNCSVYRSLHDRRWSQNRKPTRKNAAQAARKIGCGAARRGQFCAARVRRFCARICEIARELFRTQKLTLIQEICPNYDPLKYAQFSRIST